MKRILFLITILFLSACAQHRTAPDAEVRIIQSRAGATGFAAKLRVEGPEAVQQLKTWYDDNSSDCGSGSRPGPLCNGVLIRATETSNAFLPWDPSPGSIQNGGVSFSWLRKDNNFPSLVFGYKNGFIFYPPFKTPAGKNSEIAILCAFPIDADTFNRATLQGCGPHSTYPNDSKQCDLMGIETSAQWLTKYRNTNNPYAYQCGFNIREGAGQTARRMNEAINSRAGIVDSSWNVQNELRLATWATGSGATLPIQSFFYFEGNVDALAKARVDQQKYFTLYGETIPIVRIRLPQNRNGQVVFTYSDADQGTGEPGGELIMDETPVTLSAKTYVIPERPDILPPLTEGGNSVTRLPSGGTPPYIFTSSNTAVAKVEITGRVIPTGNGISTISVRDGAGQSRNYNVTYSNIIKVRHLGTTKSYSTASGWASGAGLRTPTIQEVREIQQAYLGRWPFHKERYWTSTTCLAGRHFAADINEKNVTDICTAAINLIIYGAVGIGQ